MGVFWLAGRGRVLINRSSFAQTKMKQGLVRAVLFLFTLLFRCALVMTTETLLGLGRGASGQRTQRRCG